MDQNTLQGISTIFVLIAFIGVCWWAFSPKRKKKFEEAANLPFAEDKPAENKDTELPQKKGEERQSDI